MNLVIDIGNTRIKGALFSNNELIEKIDIPNLTKLRKVIKNHTGQVGLSSVRKFTDSFSLFLKKQEVLVLDYTTPIPLVLKYQTPKTLGSDRIAAICGAWFLSPKASLVVDIGTCITLDFINDAAEFIGGNISPGPDLRFKSMNNFTAALPLERLSKEDEYIGSSTKMALRAGVKQSILHEIQGTLDSFRGQFPNCRLVLTGGYSSYFDSKLKGGIFAEPNLVFIGLNSILNYNVKE